jgi:divalent metal cation (Fe/Co/Zn/Cd) transporter
VTEAVLSLPDIISVSEVQVYYKDDGRIAVKVDVVMNPDLTIRAAHGLALKARIAVERVYPHIAAVDVDLELDDGASLTDSQTPHADLIELSRIPLDNISTATSAVSKKS